VVQRKAEERREPQCTEREHHVQNVFGFHMKQVYRVSAVER
jgi:hypothetical protein